MVAHPSCITGAAERPERLLPTIPGILCREVGRIVYKHFSFKPFQ